MSTIAEQLQELAQIKEEIRQAIINKGVTVSSDAAFSTYATAIRQINGGGSSGGLTEEEWFKMIERTITSVVIPTGTTKVADHMFRGCTRLDSITIPNTVTVLGSYCFAVCPFTSITLPSSLTIINQNVFNSCSKLESIVVPEGVTKIDLGVFNACSKLTSVDMPSTLATLGQGVFTNTPLLNTIICRATNPPTAHNQAFGSLTNNYPGKNVANGKTLYVPHGCSSNYTGATGTAWVDTLLEPTRCNFSIAELDENGNIPEL